MKTMQKNELPGNADKQHPALKDLPVEDDRYPGSFFKIPSVPRPGKTAWRST